MARGVPSGGTLGWLSQRVTAVGLVALLLLHFFVLHFGVERPLSVAKVAERLSSPLWRTLDLTFLVMALWHGTYGLWQVVQDYLHTGWKRVLVLGALGVGLLVLLILGFWTILAFRPE